MEFLIGLCCGVSLGAAIASWFYMTIKNDGYPMMDDTGNIYRTVPKNKVSDRY